MAQNDDGKNKIDLVEEFFQKIEGREKLDENDLDDFHKIAHIIEENIGIIDNNPDTLKKLINFSLKITESYEEFKKLYLALINKSANPYIYG